MFKKSNANVIVAAGGGNDSHGTLGGLLYDGQASLGKVWVVLQALGNIAFAYSYSLILIEIQVFRSFVSNIANSSCNTKLLNLIVVEG
mgnify:CR=1 FL=1